jgi:hypothetical protein
MYSDITSYLLFQTKIKIIFKKTEKNQNLTDLIISQNKMMKINYPLLILVLKVKDLMANNSFQVKILT